MRKLFIFSLYALLFIASTLAGCKMKGNVDERAIYEQAQRLILNWFQQRLDGITLDDTTKDNKTRLQELLQARKLGLPDYDIVDVSGKSHAQKFVVSCNVPELSLSATAEGQSRRQAEQIAAGKVLAELEGDESGG